MKKVVVELHAKSKRNNRGGHCSGKSENNRVPVVGEQGFLTSHSSFRSLELSDNAIPASAYDVAALLGENRSFYICPIMKFLKYKTQMKSLDKQR